MSEHTKTTSHGGAGRALLWVALLLTLALLGFVTATAVRNNPIYSDREANGISKYRFIENCKELTHDTEELTVGAAGQSIPLKTLIEQSAPLNDLNPDLRHPITGETVRAALTRLGTDGVQRLGGPWLP